MFQKKIVPKTVETNQAVLHPEANCAPQTHYTCICIYI